MSKMEKKNDNNIECEKLLKRELYKLWYFLIILSLFGFPCTLHTFGIWCANLELLRQCECKCALCACAMLENVIYECVTVWMQLHITMFESKVNLKFLHFDGLIRFFFSSRIQRSCVYRYLSFPKRFNSIRFISNIHNLYIHGECVCVYACACSILRSGQYCPISIRLSKIECNLLVLIFRAIVLLLFPCPFTSRLFIAQKKYM